MHYCYILYNDINNLTYNGYTNNLVRRLRQHNGEIKGGARFTTRQLSKGVVWKYLCIVASSDASFDKIKALQLEWHIKYPNCKRPRPKCYNGALGRVQGVAHAVVHQKFDALGGLDIHILSEFEHGLESLQNQRKINIVLHKESIVVDDIMSKSL